MKNINNRKCGDVNQECGGSCEFFPKYDRTSGFIYVGNDKGKINRYDRTDYLKTTATGDWANRYSLTYQ